MVSYCSDDVRILTLASCAFAANMYLNEFDVNPFYRVYKYCLYVHASFSQKISKEKWHAFDSKKIPRQFLSLWYWNNFVIEIEWSSILNNKWFVCNGNEGDLKMNHIFSYIHFFNSDLVHFGIAYVASFPQNIFKFIIHMFIKTQ